MQFSNKELKDLFFAWLLISLAFAILFSGGLGGFSEGIDGGFGLVFLLSGLTVGISFLFHELMHKFYAQRYGLWAEFRAFYKYLFFAVFLSFLGFIIAAPGAVMIRGSLSKERNGKISLAGPMTNIVLGIISFVFLLVFSGGILGMFFGLSLRINSLLAVFNLLPVPGFDGRKVYEWDNMIYFVSIAIAGFLFIGSLLV